MATKNEERERKLEEKKKETRAQKLMRCRNVEDWMNLSGEDFRAVTEFICELRATINSDGLYPRKLAVDTQKLRIELIERDSDQYSSELSKNSKDIEAKSKELKKAEKELEEAKEKVEKLKEKIRKLENQESRILKKIGENDQLLENSIDILRKMGDVVLFHPSATLHQIYKYQCENIYVTKNDVGMFSMLEDRTGGVFSINEVLDADKLEHFVTKFPSDFFFKYSEEERESIVSYCDVLINLKMSEDGSRKIIPAFHSTTIAEILRLNGLEDFRP